METTATTVQFADYPSERELARLIGTTGCKSSSNVLRNTQQGFEVVIEPLPAKYVFIWMSFIAVLAGWLIGRNDGWRQVLGMTILFFTPGILMAALFDGFNQTAAEQGPWLQYRAADRTMSILGLNERIEVAPENQELILSFEPDGQSYTGQQLLLRPHQDGWQAVRLWHAMAGESSNPGEMEALAELTARRLGLRLKRIGNRQQV